MNRDQGMKQDRPAIDRHKQLERAQRLRKIWDMKRSEIKLTQRQVAERLGWKTQGAVGHVLSGNSALTIDLLLEFCELLSIAPYEIVPEIKALTEQAAPPQTVTEARSTKPYSTDSIEQIDLGLLVQCVGAVEKAAKEQGQQLESDKQTKLIEFIYAERTAGNKPADETDDLANRLVALAVNS